MDPTIDGLELGNLRSDDQGALSLVLNTKTGEYKFIPIPYQKSYLNFEKHDITFTIEKDGSVRGTDTITLRGRLSHQIRRILRTGEHANKFYQSVIAQVFPGSTLITGVSSDPLDITKPLSITLTMDASALLTMENGKMRLKIPDQILPPKLVKLKERILPMDLGIKSEYETSVKIELPEKSNISYFPADYAVENSCFDVVRKSEKSEGYLTIQTKYVKECTLLEAKTYPEFRKSALEVIKRQNDHVEIENAER